MAKMSCLKYVSTDLVILTNILNKQSANEVELWCLSHH